MANFMGPQMKAINPNARAEKLDNRKIKARKRNIIVSTNEVMFTTNLSNQNM